MRHSPNLAPNPRIGLYYAAGAVLLILGMVLAGPWGLPLAWPALSMSIVAAGYVWLGPAIYGKRNGRISFLSRIVLAPTLVGQYLSLLHYRRQCRPWDEVSPGVFIGCRLTCTHANRLSNEGVGSVLDLTAEFSEIPVLRKMRYRNIPILDLTAPTPAQLNEAIHFIRESRALGTAVFVHCKSGYSRSAAVAGAYLLATGISANSSEAVARMRTARPQIVIRPEVRKALQQFESARQAPRPGFRFRA